MLDLFFIIFCCLTLFNFKIKGIDDYFYDYMELDETNCIKGIFVWLIIFYHKTAYINKTKYLYMKITGNLGQKVVSMFFFYSSFGICEAIKKKGVIYAKTLKNKAIILFLKSQVIILIYLVANIVILKKKITFKKYLLSLIFRDSLGNSNWFAFTIIIFYLYSYLSFIFAKNNILLGIIIINLFCFFHAKYVFTYYYPKKIFTIDTILCFVIGFYYSLIKAHLDKIIMKNDIFYFGILSITIFSFYKSSNFNNLFFISLKNALFAILVAFTSMKIKLKNDLLKFLNTHSYSIYLFQRLIMLITFEKKIFINSDFAQIFFEFTSLFFISSLYDKYIVFLNKIFEIKAKFIHKNNYFYIDNKNYI
jgi:hypothetical protein